MTLAICIKCGAQKTGAFNDCAACGFEPLSEKDLALSLALTSHYWIPEALEQMGEQIARGTTASFDWLAPLSEEQLVSVVRDPRMQAVLGLAHRRQPSRKGLPDE